MIIITVVSSTCKLVLGLVVNIVAETLPLNNCSVLFLIIVLTQSCRTDSDVLFLEHVMKCCENFNILIINMSFEIESCM